MGKMVKLTAISLLAGIVLAGSGTAGAAGLSKDLIYGETGKVMTTTSVMAGSGDEGYKDGDNPAAFLREPQSLIVQADGSVLFTDSRNQRVRKLAGGKVSTVAGLSLDNDVYGFPVGALIDGAADRSLFNRPAGIIAGPDGSLYVADSGNHAIRRIAKDGSVTTVAGDGVLGSRDGKGKDARFYAPKDVAAAADGTLYVADSLNHAIRKIGADGTVTTLNAPSARVVENVPGHAESTGDYKDGSLKEAKFNEPSGLALDAKGNLYVSDSGNQRIRYIDLAAGTVTTVAGNAAAAYEPTALYAEGDYADGPADKALFNFPAGLAVTPEGGLLIADSLNHAVRYLMNGQVITLSADSTLSPGETNGIEGYGQLHLPTDVALSADGAVLVADSFNNKVRMIKPYHLPAAQTAGDDIRVAVGEKLVEFETKPQLTNGRTMVPVRAIAEAMGYKVEYVDGERLVKLSNDSVTIEMKIGRDSVKSMAPNQEEITEQMDVAPYISDDKTFVPVRFFAEQGGWDVQWHPISRTAIIRPRTE